MAVRVSPSLVLPSTLRSPPTFVLARVEREFWTVANDVKRVDPMAIAFGVENLPAMSMPPMVEKSPW